jgi:hypothetical protein
MFGKRMVFGVVLLALFLVIGVLAFTAVSGTQVTAVAHHNAPVDNNTDVGNLNQDMVHNGIEERNNSNGTENGAENWSDPLG